MPSKDGDRESEESRKRKARSEMIEKIPVMALAGNRRNKVDLTLLGHSFRMLLEFGAGWEAGSVHALKCMMMNYKK